MKPAEKRLRFNMNVPGDAITLQKSPNISTSGNPFVQQHQAEDTDNFELFLTAGKLPYYCEARRRSLAHTRLVIRIEFLSWCWEHGLTPTEVVHRPMPTQGLELTSWKSSVQDCEKIMLNHMITVCNGELVNRRREMETSDVALMECLQADPPLLERARAELSQKNVLHQRCG